MHAHAMHTTQCKPALCMHAHLSLYIYNHMQIQLLEFASLYTYNGTCSASEIIRTCQIVSEVLKTVFHQFLEASQFCSLSLHSNYVYISDLLKGTVQRDFLTPVFFTKRLILVSIDMPPSDFEIFRILRELFVLKLLKNRLPAVNYSEESKTEP
jgi:hypothetical protein